MESNRLHHSKPSSNHSIEPHQGQLTPRRMEDQTLNKPQAKFNIIKMKDVYDTHDCMAKHN
jgi:hypothetical protein